MNPVVLSDVTAWARLADPIDVSIVLLACVRSLLQRGWSGSSIKAMIGDVIADPNAGVV